MDNSDLKTHSKQSERVVVNNIFAPDNETTTTTTSPPRRCVDNGSSKSVATASSASSSWLSTGSTTSSPQQVGATSNNESTSSRLCWVDPNPIQMDQLKAFVTAKIDKGNGENIISLGVSETEEYGFTNQEMSTAAETLASMERLLSTSVLFLRERKVTGSVNSSNSLAAATESRIANETETIAGNNDKEKATVSPQQHQHQQQQQQQRFVRDYLVRKVFSEEDFIEVRVAVVGNVDSGKSTLLGVLTHGVLDDGRGDARTKLFRHKHEIESGRTSSVGNDILGFDARGRTMNEPPGGAGAVSGSAGTGHVAKCLDWESICRLSSKVVTFIDLAGHEKYLKTTVFGMTGHDPNFCCILVGANMGVVGMTKEHLGLALALSVPVFVVITKIDMCPPNVYQETLKVLQKVLKSPGCRKIAYLIENHDDMITCAMNFTSERLCPIFQVSNVTGQNLDLLKAFLNLLNTKLDSYANEPAEFQIDDLYSVPGVGTVVSGTCYKGRIQLNDTLLLGPDLIGQFRPVAIKGVHRKRLPVKECKGGQTASFALKKIKRSELRKGMMLISEKLNPVASWEFEAEILVLHHPTTISINYQAMVHCGSIRQTATIQEMSVQHMRTGDKATVRFAFIKNPEYLKVGTKMIFREGRTKAVGTISKVFHISSKAT